MAKIKRKTPTRRKRPPGKPKVEAETPPSLTVRGDWRRLFSGEPSRDFQLALRCFLESQRWFGGKAKSIRTISILDSAPIGGNRSNCSFLLTMITAQYDKGPSESYLVPFGFRKTLQLENSGSAPRLTFCAHLTIKNQAGTQIGELFDAAGEQSFATALLDLFDRKGRAVGRQGKFVFSQGTLFFKHRGNTGPLASRLVSAEQSNSSIAMGDRLILKLLRRLEPGIHPDLEIGRYLSDQASFPHTPKTLGDAWYQPAGNPTESTSAIAILQEFVPNTGDAWSFSLTAARSFVNRVLDQSDDARTPPTEAVATLKMPLMKLTLRETPQSISKMMGEYLLAAERLGERTAGLHIALAAAGTQIFRRFLFHFGSNGFIAKKCSGSRAGTGRFFNTN